MQITKLLPVVGAVLLATSAMAADVNMYGALDTGLRYEKFKGQDGALTMHSSGKQDIISFVGLTTQEKIGDEYYVKATLESAIAADTGAVYDFPTTKSGLFSLQSTLSVGNSHAEMSFGRMGALTSGYGPYSQYMAMRFNPGRSHLGELGPGGVTVNHMIVDNAVAFTTKGDIWVAALYSNGDTTEANGDQESVLDWSDRRHLMQGAVGFRHGPLQGGVILTQDDQVYTGTGMKKDPARYAHATLSYKFDSCIVGGVLFYGKDVYNVYQNHVSSFVAGANIGRSAHQMDIKTALFQIALPRGQHFLGFSTAYSKSEWKGVATGMKDTEGSLWRIGGVYRYNLSKRTYAYVSAAYTDADKLVESVTNQAYSIGMTHRF